MGTDSVVIVGGKGVSGGEKGYGEINVNGER